MNDEYKRFVVSVHRSEFITYLCGFCYFARFDAACANFEAFGSARLPSDADRLQIWIEATTGAIVRVRNIVAELRPLTADFAAFSHDFELPPRMINESAFASTENVNVAGRNENL